MRGKYIFPPSRPTPSSRGTTRFENKIADPKQEGNYPTFLRCLICGFPNHDNVIKCAFCEAENWKGDYD